MFIFLPKFPKFSINFLKLNSPSCLAYHTGFTRLNQTNHPLITFFFFCYILLLRKIYLSILYAVNPSVWALATDQLYTRKVIRKSVTNYNFKDENLKITALWKTMFVDSNRTLIEPTCGTNLGFVYYSHKVYCFIFLCVCVWVCVVFLFFWFFFCFFFFFVKLKESSPPTCDRQVMTESKSQFSK